MRKMTPALGYDKNGELARKIFCECVNGYRSDEIKKRLLVYSEAVSESAEKYERMIPREIGSFSCGDEISPQIGRDLRDVYSNKFAAQGAPGRGYYDLIRQSAPQNVCPVCGVIPVTCVDHYLPKAKYPLLSVAPSNLIPLCGTCNGIQKKGNYCGDSFDEMLFHPYFDKLPESAWLKAKLILSSEPRVDYFVDYPNDGVVERRLTIHFERYALGALYSIQAIRIFHSRKRIWSKHLGLEGECSLASLLQDESESAVAEDPLSWEAAFYAALVSQYDEVAKWLQANIQANGVDFFGL